jgi:hypothetical protein
MSFAEARIREYRASTAAVEMPQTEVSFAKTRIGDLEIVIVAKNRRTAPQHDAAEDEIEQQLSREGFIRLPGLREPLRGEFKLIDVAGKPISEMITEERR